MENQKQRIQFCYFVSFMLNLVITRWMTLSLFHKTNRIRTKIINSIFQKKTLNISSDKILKLFFCLVVLVHNVILCLHVLTDPVIPPEAAPAVSNTQFHSVGTFFVHQCKSTKAAKRLYGKWPTVWVENLLGKSQCVLCKMWSAWDFLKSANNDSNIHQMRELMSLSSLSQNEYLHSEEETDSEQKMLKSEEHKLEGE